MRCFIDLIVPHVREVVQKVYDLRSEVLLGSSNVHVVPPVFWRPQFRLHHDTPSERLCLVLAYNARMR